MRAAIPTPTAAYQAAPTWINRWKGETEGKGTHRVRHRGTHTSSACFWSAHLDVDKLPLLVPEVMAYSDPPAKLPQQSPCPSIPPSLHILHSKDLLCLRGRREALSQQLHWQTGALAGRLEQNAGGHRECEWLFKNQDGKKRTKCKKKKNSFSSPDFHIKIHSEVH